MNDKPTQIEQVYGKNHWDNGNYQSLCDNYAGKPWKRGLEIGFAWSMSARAFLDTLPDATLLSLDMNDAMAKAKSMKEYGKRWELKLGDSSTLMKSLKEKFDYIYIDGDHTYEGVKKDLDQASRLLAKGGQIICDDYGNAQSIRDAVADFCAEHQFIASGPIERNANGAVVLCKS
jgi:predicted O-methyltransferase YrrM